MRLYRNKKALSPIFATLILIAIAVIAGIIVYMFTSGTLAAMLGGGTAGQEKVAIQGVDVANDAVLAQCTGGGPVTITNYIVKNSAGAIEAQATLPAAATFGTADGVETISLAATTLSGLDPGTYTITLISQAGGSFVSPSFTVA